MACIRPMLLCFTFWSLGMNTFLTEQGEHTDQYYGVVCHFLWTLIYKIEVGIARLHISMEYTFVLIHNNGYI